MHKRCAVTFAFLIVSCACIASVVDAQCMSGLNITVDIYGPSHIPACASNFTLCAFPNGFNEPSANLTYAWSASDPAVTVSSLVTQCISITGFPAATPTTFSVNITSPTSGCTAISNNFTVIRDAVSQFPSVNIRNQYENGTLMIPGVNGFRLTSRIYDFSCLPFESYNYLWRVWDLTNNVSVALPNSVASNSSFIDFSPLLFDVRKVYRASIYSFFGNLAAAGAYSESSVDFAFSRSPLVVFVQGGNRTLSRLYPIVINASTSYDPEGLDAVYGRSFSWSCRVLENAQGQPQTDCVLGTYLVNNHASALTLQGTDLFPNWKYRFTVSLDVGSRTATNIVDLTSSRFRGPSISLITDFPTRVSASNRIVIQVQVVFTSSVTYSWSSATLELSKNNIMGSVNEPMLTIAPNVLAGGSIHNFTVTVFSAGTISQASTTIWVNRPPENGTITMSAPPEGLVSLSTRAVVACNNWIDPEGDYPLSYKYELLASGQQQFTPLQDWSVDHVLTLPLLSNNSYVLRCIAKDSLGSTASVEHGFTVMPRTPTFSAAGAVLFANTSTRQAVCRSDPYGFLFSLLGSAGELNTGSRANQSDSTETSIRCEARASLMELFGNLADVRVRTWTPDTETLVYAFLDALTAFPQEVTPDLASQVVSAAYDRLRGMGMIEVTSGTSLDKNAAVFALTVLNSILRATEQLQATAKMSLVLPDVEFAPMFSPLSMDILKYEMEGCVVLAKRIARAAAISADPADLVMTNIRLRTYRGAAKNLLPSTQSIVSGDNSTIFEFPAFAPNWFTSVNDLWFTIVEFPTNLLHYAGPEVENTVSCSTAIISTYDGGETLNFLNATWDSAFSVSLRVLAPLNESVGYEIVRVCNEWQPTDQVLIVAAKCSPDYNRSTTTVVVCRCFNTGTFAFGNFFRYIPPPEEVFVYRLSASELEMPVSGIAVSFVVGMVLLEMAICIVAIVVDRRQCHRAVATATKYEELRRSLNEQRSQLLKHEATLQKSADKWWSAARKSLSVTSTTLQASTSHDTDVTDIKRRRRDHSRMALHRFSSQSLSETQSPNGSPDVLQQSQTDPIDHFSKPVLLSTMFSSCVKEMVGFVPASCGLQGLRVPDMRSTSLQGIVVDRRLSILLSRMLWCAKHVHMIAGLFWRSSTDRYSRMARTSTLFSNIHLSYLACLCVYYFNPALDPNDGLLSFFLALPIALGCYCVFVLFRLFARWVLNRVRDERILYKLRKQGRKQTSVQPVTASTMSLQTGDDGDSSNLTATLAHLFDLCDDDNDDLLSCDDLIRGLAKFRPDFTSEIVAAIFDEMSIEQGRLNDVALFESVDLHGQSELSAFKRKEMERRGLKVEHRAANAKTTKKDKARLITKDSFMTVMHNWYNNHGHVDEESVQALALAGINRNDTRSALLETAVQELESQFWRRRFRRLAAAVKKDRFIWFGWTAGAMVGFVVFMIFCCVVLYLTGGITSANFVPILAVSVLLVIIAIATSVAVAVRVFYPVSWAIIVYAFVLSPPASSTSDASATLQYADFYSSLNISEEMIVHMGVLLAIWLAPLFFPLLFRIKGVRHLGLLLFLASLCALPSFYVAGLFFAYSFSLQLGFFILLGVFALIWYGITRAGYAAWALWTLAFACSPAVFLFWLFTKSSNALLTAAVWSGVTFMLFVSLGIVVISIQVTSSRMAFPPRLAWEHQFLPYILSFCVTVFCLILNAYWGSHLRDDREVAVLRTFAFVMSIQLVVFDPVYCVIKAVVDTRWDDLRFWAQHFVSNTLGGRGFAVAVRPFGHHQGQGREYMTP